MSNATICLKSVNDLLAKSFIVPSYQRGYRWTRRQVQDLLDDLWEFETKCGREDKNSFYCLQPVVVKERPEVGWELIDGQQRLTTLFLLLTYLKPILEVLGKSRFTLTFETRSNSGAFLQNIDRSQKDANIDYHHICNAYEAIEKWFDGRDGNQKLKLLQCLLNDDTLGRNVKVIWYELPEMEDPIEAFTRLNVGKIPLTNAELIRALFLRSGNFGAATVSLQQLKIAQEWDGIEKVLQSDDVWYFLHCGNGSPTNRIEYLFQLISKTGPEVPSSADDNFATFQFYIEKLSAPNAKVDAEWLKIKKYFMTLEEWFRDRNLYHLIGYLIHEGDDLLEIRNLGKLATKSTFQKILKGRIFNRLVGRELADYDNGQAGMAIIKTKVIELDYESDRETIRSFLLLFNIATLLQNDSSNLRFPFDSYKKEKWDIEHVRSVASGKPNRPDGRREWLKHASEYLDESGENQDLCIRTQALLGADKLDGMQFDELYIDLLKHFGEDGDTDADNSIGNLALLDAATNRSYKNAVFPVKRKVILVRDREGTFVPLCTKNVFLKCYSARINNMMFWGEGDNQAYLEVIVETIADFFWPKEGGQI